MVWYGHYASKSVPSSLRGSGTINWTNVRQERVLAAGLESVVPVRMSLMPTDAKRVHLGLCHFDACFVLIGVKERLHPESALCRRGTYQIYDCLIVDQRLPFPGKTDEREESVLDLVPLARSWRVMANRDSYPEFVR